ncbi:twin arginine translocase protein A [Slackia heliotrinireducens]|uniref:Sec-independent protein secretion pathway component n=1 Tax=Slackia heliotrinireducens (strain ATCC 29202 / DSM 20476 / NCTC 11029 / RHS 1) TaxID=471855 RepID=C7N7W3_SLAHD|nr:twin-arginine translocase TatA/TatE family subunit [Slackia heliotrinireducens]ACV22998.1 Sec-independent protein secretion pathway component [Slackia heliotrinireducens DSM 20476]VEH01889.1 twin arginine translocase protein A [Slackia heliotrinireducens]
MFGIGGFELFLILLFGFLIFGPDKLPQIAKVIGQALAKFRSAQDEMNRVVKDEVFDPSAADPIKNPVKSIDKANKQKVERKESFSSRKAKYDRERAEKKKREASNEAAREVREAAKKATEETAAETAAAAGAAATAAAAPKKGSNVKLHQEVMAARKAASEETAADIAAKREADAALADEIFAAPAAKKSAPKTEDVAEGEDA